MSDSNDYYDFEDRGPVIREQKKEAFWRGLSLGLVIAAAVSVILTVLNGTTKSCRRYPLPPPEKRATGTRRSVSWRNI